MKTILITGGAGFIGSNFLIYLSQVRSNYKLVNLDKLTYAANLSNLDLLKNNKNYQFVDGDICDKELVRNLFNEHDITDVIHFAAESHVDNSIKNPEIFIQTNVNGTFNLLNTAFNYWFEMANKPKKGFEHSRFHHISTDEVYGSLGETGFFTESTPYAPNSPYSASKASSDLLVRSFYHTFGMNLITTNCSNNFGPHQHEEKLIPTIIRTALAGNEIPIYGDGKNIRDWLYVGDHCKALLLAFEDGVTGEVYNIGGDNELQNIDIATKICSHLDLLKPKDSSYRDQITFVEDRLGHDRRYAVDCTKIKKELKWQGGGAFSSNLLNTIKWYIGV